MRVEPEISPKSEQLSRQLEVLKKINKHDSENQIIL